MIRVGTIGTSWLTEQFIEACLLTNQYQIQGVYSRSAYRARDIATVFKAEYYTDELNNILFDPDIDLIYIASPNSLHYEQAMRAVRAGKHVIVEKPAFTNVQEWHDVFNEAERMGVYVFEAALHVHNRNYRRLKQLVEHKLHEAEQPFLGANFNFGQYSSRYFNYLDSMESSRNIPNVFNPQYAGGTLMDLGVYPIYVVIDIFGHPSSIRYNAQKGPNGIDLFGHILFIYDDFQVNIFISKVVHSVLPSEIYIDDETIVIHEISKIRKVELINKDGEVANVIDYRPENVMYDEVLNFADIINHREDIHWQLQYERWKQLSLSVAQSLELLRKSADLSFEIEEEDDA